MVQSLLWVRTISTVMLMTLSPSTAQSASAAFDTCPSRISLPAVWTNASNVSFNYTGFHAASTLHFTWCLGTSPGASDIIPCTALTGKVIPNTNIIADEAVPHGISVLQQDYTLDSKLLLEGQLYFLMIQVLDKQAKSIAQMVAPPIKIDSRLPSLAARSVVYTLQDCCQCLTFPCTAVFKNTWRCCNVLGEADSRCITHKHQQGQLHAVRLHTSRKLLAVSALHMCQHRGPWFKSLLSALQLRLRQISSRFTALLLSMLHLWVAAVISPGIGMSSNMAASPPSHFWGPTATLPGTAELQQRTRSLLQTPWANPVTTPLTPLTVTEPSASPQGQLPFGGSLPSGIASFAQVTATTNAASDVPSASTLQTVSNASSNRSLLIAIVVLAAIGVSVLLVALLTAFIVRRRLVRRQEETRAQRGQIKQLKGLMHGLVNVTGDPQKQQEDAIRNARELAFLITDLQDSTAMAAANPAAFRKVQDIHDTLLHEGIAKYNGYEINTEGDSFHIAFTSVAAAVQVAMETQVRLLDTDWPKDVLKLPACGQEKDSHGEKIFRGPRVRMGIHWAVEGTVANRLHLVTKHRVFSGPGFALAQELGDAASGGQVLLSHDAWLNLRHNMCDAGFPQVEQLGMYKLEAWPAPFWIYQVSHQLGRPMYRKFPPPRKIDFVEQGWGLNIAPPPEPRTARNLLTFVACRLFLPRGAARLPKSMANALYQIVAMVAQQFEGYIFSVNIEEGRCMLTFAKAVDAVRFCHAAQTNILYHKWPPEALDMSGKIEHTPDGRLLFRGPRVAMAVHETDDYVEEVHVTEPMLTSQREDAVVYQGDGEKFTRRLSKVIHGGQVVLSEIAWASIQDQIPGQSQIISLGSHSIDADFEQAVLLMEIMPSLLAKRHFDPLNTLHQLEPGYRDSPEPSENMAIVFVKVGKPAEVRDAEQASSPVSDDTILRVITDFNVGVGKYTKLVRRLLPKYAGYECKEPEGKFTLSFRPHEDAVRWCAAVQKKLFNRLLEDAVRWCAAMQKELLLISWPEALLQWGDCREQRDPETGAVVWRGLRVRMGMAYGRPAYKKPLNTGRADYFGNLPNLAARVMALANPGQVLLEGFWGFGPELKRGPDDLASLLPQRPSRISGEPDYEAIEVVQLGKFPIKGLDDPKLICQCLPVSLSGRTFSLPSSAERVPGDASLKRLKLGTSFGGGEDSPARSLIIAARDHSKRLSSFFGLISRSSSRGTELRPSQVMEATRRTGSTIILPSPRELELVRSHNSQVVPGAPRPPTYATATRSSMSGLAQVVFQKVLGNRTDSATSSRAGQSNSPRAQSGTSPRALSGRWLSLLSRAGQSSSLRAGHSNSLRARQGDSPRAHSGTSPRALSGRWLSLLSRGIRRDSCPQTPLTGSEPQQDPAASLEAYPTLGRGGPPRVRVPQSRMAKHRSASEGEDSPESDRAAGSDYRDGYNMPRRDSPTSHRLQHSHSDMSPHHSMDSASMSPLFHHQLQQPSQTGLPPSRHNRSVTADQLSWPRGSNRGQEGARSNDWGGLNAMAGTEPDLLSRRLRVDVTSLGPPSESADSTGSEANTPNTVYAREVAQLFVSGRHNQFKDSSRFGSLEGSRTLSSSRALQHAPTPSLPSNDSIGGPVHAHSMPPDLQSAPALAATLAASRLGFTPSLPQGALASAQTLPATRFSALSEPPYDDPIRPSVQGASEQPLQPQFRDNRLFVPSSGHREARYAHQRFGSMESVGGSSAQADMMYPEQSEPSWVSDNGSVSRRAYNASHLAVHFEGDEVVEISDISTMLDSDHHLERM